jgi:PII-like signaling protein
MEREVEQTLLRVFLRNTLKYSWWATAGDTLLQRALRRGLVGETTLVGFLGLDASGKLIESSRWALVKQLPLVLEFFDSPQAIGGLLSDLIEVVPEGLASLERVHVLIYRDGSTNLSRPPAYPPASQPPGAAGALPSPEEFPIMLRAVDGQLLRIFVDDTDTYAGQPLYRAIIEYARDQGLTNAVVLRAPMGFGTHRRVHTDRFPDSITDLPVLIEIVGTADELARLYPFLDEAVPEGLITIENVKMLRLGKPAAE